MAKRLPSIGRDGGVWWHPRNHHGEATFASTLPTPHRRGKVQGFGGAT